MMFSVYCPTHDSRILMTRRNALSFWNGPHGPVIQWRCDCGQEGFLDPHGCHAIPSNHPIPSIDRPADGHGERLVA